MSRTKPTSISLLLTVLLCSSLLLTGCDTSLSIDVGAIRVTVTAVGNNFDPDGYTIRVTSETDQQSQAVAVNGEVLFAVSTGRHIVELLDKEPNCVVDLSPQVAQVSAGNTVEVLFNTLCA